MNQNDTVTLMLLVAHFLALGVAVMVFGWVIYLHRRNRALERLLPAAGELPPRPAGRPTTWLAVRSLESSVVRAALPDRGRFCVSPRVNGWVIVTGSGLPDPSDDVDGCFRFLIAVSRKLGHVQFFHMEKYSAHHAWARMDEGCVTRAYAWAGETIWNQGAATQAETRLAMRCSEYGEEAGGWTTREHAAANVEKTAMSNFRYSPTRRRASVICSSSFSEGKLMKTRESSEISCSNSSRSRNSSLARRRRVMARARAIINRASMHTANPSSVRNQAVCENSGAMANARPAPVSFQTPSLLAA